MSLKPLVAELFYKDLTLDRFNEVATFQPNKGWDDFRRVFDEANRSTGSQGTRERITSIAEALSEVVKSTTLTEMYGWA